MHGVVDEKTDVFAFGVFLLEIISGKKPVDGSHQSLHSWVMVLLGNNITSVLASLLIVMCCNIHKNSLSTPKINSIRVISLASAILP